MSRLTFIDMEKPIAGRIKSSGVVSEFSKVTDAKISEKYDYMDTVSGVFYKANEIEFQEPEHFYGQICQDPELTKKFRELHKELVDRVIEFCNKNSVEIDDFYLHADGIRGSIPYGSWQACTDSGFEMYRQEDIENENVDPFLYSI